MSARRLLARVSTTLCVALAATSAQLRAQSYNVDIGVSSLYPTPSSTYGAAAGQTGAWNSVPCSVGTSTTIFDLAGNSGLVNVKLSGGATQQSQTNLPGASVDALALLADAHDPGAASQTWTIAGLASGEYVVYAYALSPANAQYRTIVRVAGSPDVPQTVGGPWSGTFTLGVTHARHRISVSAGSSIAITVERATQPAVNFAALSGFQIVQTSTSGTPFCSGDGTDPTVTTACPCQNKGLALHGCANSANPVGASLRATGSTALDNVVLRAAEMPASVLCVFFQGDALVDQPYGDGILCVGGALVRLRQRVAMSGASVFPDTTDTWTLSQRGGVTPGSGDVRVYQAYYRNASTLFCPPSTFNATNGWRIAW